MMKNMITIAKDFQTSVNIAYDLGDPQKIKQLIPTKAALDLMEEILLSTNDTSTRRARILIGAYGKGKSHIVLSILSVLWHKDVELYEKLMKKLSLTNPDCYQYIQEYLASSKRLLPIVISGSSTSLTQSFLSALHTAIRQNNMTDILPETQFQAAVNMINRWEKEFPATYELMAEYLEQPVELFVQRLLEFDAGAYMMFEKMYPLLTSGSDFNPFSGFEVVEVYEKVAKNIAQYGYNGLFVVYDEFSKYLEANITTASVSDTKMLQDFAERCNRSGVHQLHLLLISHKEVENYIDKLPRQKVDGWRGVSERFSHVTMHSDFSQIYEIIAATIIKNKEMWDEFVKKYNSSFENLYHYYRESRLFDECSDDIFRDLVWGCYPLHPITTYILPRLSEKVAQNERTMFTFLSGQENGTLYATISGINKAFGIVTPDILFDYFSSQLRNEPYTSETHKVYTLASSVLRKIDSDLEKKIVKTIALIYIMEQFERLEPTADAIMSIYQDAGYSFEEIKNAIDNLSSVQAVVYLKRSNAYFRLKESTNIDIPQMIEDVKEKRARSVTDQEILNNANVENYLYPTKYNDDHEMTRYFQFIFMGVSEVKDFKCENFQGDGVVVGVFPDQECDDFNAIVQEVSCNNPQTVFIRPINTMFIHDVLREYDAVSILRESASDDNLLFEEYDVIYQDLLEVIQSYIAQFIQPEYGAAQYYYAGQREKLYRKANLTQLLSKVCEQMYPNTPLINNEVLNKNNITTVAINSRTKLLNGILNGSNQLNLGMSGNGQEISFMRSTLVVPGLLIQTDGVAQLGWKTGNEKLQLVIDKIIEFIESTKDNGRNLEELYEILMGKSNGIGMRKGVIPVYLALVLKKYDGHIIVRDVYGERRISADFLTELNNNPADFTIELETWSDEKESYISGLDLLFEDFVMDAEKQLGGYSYIVHAMSRWYLSLPKCAKDSKKVFRGYFESEQFKKVDGSKRRLLDLLKQPGIGAQDLLFSKLPACFGYGSFTDNVLDNIIATKGYFDTARYNLEVLLIEDAKRIIDAMSIEAGKSLGSVLKDWYESLTENTHGYLFPNSAERVLAVAASATNDEHLIINQLGKALIDLRIDDWNEMLIIKFCERLTEYVSTINEFNNKEDDSAEIPLLGNSGEYSVVFVDAQGQSYSKSFKREECSKRAQILKREISSAIDEMGQSISPQEKRQVLMEVLEKYC